MIARLMIIFDHRLRKIRVVSHALIKDESDDIEQRPTAEASRQPGVHLTARTQPARCRR